MWKVSVEVAIGVSGYNSFCCYSFKATEGNPSTKCPVQFKNQQTKATPDK